MGGEIEKLAGDEWLVEKCSLTKKASKNLLGLNAEAFFTINVNPALLIDVALKPRSFLETFLVS